MWGAKGLYMDNQWNNWARCREYVFRVSSLSTNAATSTRHTVCISILLWATSVYWMPKSEFRPWFPCWIRVEFICECTRGVGEWIWFLCNYIQSVGRSILGWMRVSRSSKWRVDGGAETFARGVEIRGGLQRLLHAISYHWFEEVRSCTNSHV